MASLRWATQSRGRMLGVAASFAIFSALASLAYFGGFSDGVYVHGSGMPETNGVYDWAIKGWLVQNGASRASEGGTKVPTLMNMLAARSWSSPLSHTRMPSIQLQGGTWILGVAPAAFYTAPGSASVPPEAGWQVAPKGKSPAPTTWERGSVPDNLPRSFHDPPAPGPMSKFLNSPAMTVLRKQPVNCGIIALCCYIWYLLRTTNSGWPEVGSSYRNVLFEGQLWRIITASFSHVEVLHLGMNMVSLYNCGWLEEMYGSFMYLVLSLTLVVLTMVVSLFIYHILITRFNKPHYIETIGVGYSCVLFSLIVVATAKTDKYCPLPGLQQVCFPTWNMRLPGTSLDVPFNPAPFALLLAMHYLIPKASFVGHLSGIVMGYPLAWGFLDWFGLQLLARVCVACVLIRELWFSEPSRALGGASANASFSNYTVAAGLSPSAGDVSNKSRNLFLLAATYAGIAGVALLSGTWSTIVCDMSGAILAYYAWNMSAGTSAALVSGDAQFAAAPASIPASRMRVLLSFGGVALVDLVCGVLRILPMISGAGGMAAWRSGSIPFTFTLGVAAACVSLLASAGVIWSIAFICKNFTVSSDSNPSFSGGASIGSPSSGGLFWFLPEPLRPHIGAGAPSSSVLQNGVLISRAAQREARLAALSTGVGAGGRIGAIGSGGTNSSGSGNGGRRLGTS